MLFHPTELIGKQEDGAALSKASGSKEFIIPPHIMTGFVLWPRTIRTYVVKVNGIWQGDVLKELSQVMM